MIKALDLFFTFKQSFLDFHAFLGEDEDLIRRSDVHN